MTSPAGTTPAGTSPAGTTPAPISVQLYSLREECARDFPAVLRGLGAAGFVGVELAGMHGLSPSQLNDVLAESGLVVSSGHFGASPDVLLGSLEEFQAVGCNTAILAYLPPEHFSDRDAIAATAKRINETYRVAADHGIQFGYHNHWWEFETQIDGRTAWSLLWDQLEPGVVAELDVYWATVGGVNPVDAIRDLGDRLALLHVKDGPANDPKAPMVSVGSGTLDIPGILAAAPTAQWHVVELDRCATDMTQAVEASLDYLVSNGLSRGRAVR